MIYTSINNYKIKNIKKLNIKKYRDSFGLFLIEGEHLVKEAFDKGYLKELILEENTNFSLDVDTIFVSKSVLNYISNLDNPSSVMGVCIKRENLLFGKRIVILDDVQDPGNLGTIVRSCVAFNVDTLILSKGCVDLYNPKVLRATQGMIFSLNIIISDNLVDTINNLKDSGFKIFSTNVKNGNSLKSIEKNDRFAIIMGNEGNGVSDDIAALADSYIYIDMNSACESLNVAVATSIILYELDK